MSRIIQIKAHRAGSIGDHCAPLVYLTIGDEMPELGKMTLAAFDAIFQRDAEAIENALHEALPGGTYDRLLVLMLRQKASHFRVSWATLLKEYP